MALSPFPHTIPTIFSFSYLTVLGDNTAGLFSDISGLAVKLLVVESEAPLAAHLKRLLEQAGMSVETAENGIEGEIKAYCGRYDMVVVDWMLPGQDGCTLVERLHEARVHCPILMLTAISGEHDRIEGLDAGADGYLLKPFLSEDLIKQVRTLFERKIRMN
jgi:DNA-binding response OmpR family regulator